MCCSLGTWPCIQSAVLGVLALAVVTRHSEALRTHSEMQVRVRFDVDEALEELTRLELVERIGSAEGNGNGNGSSLYKCVKSEDAIQNLDHTWRAILQSRLQNVEAPSDSDRHDRSRAA